MQKSRRMRDQLFEEAMVTLLEYTDDVKGIKNKSLIVREYGVAAYLIALACEELEESISHTKAGSALVRHPPLRLWPEASKWFTKKIDRDLINAVFFGTVIEGQNQQEKPGGEQ